MDDAPKVQIPDLGIGNIASVQNMVRKAGGQAEVLRRPVELDPAARIIIVGVGAFDPAMQALTESGWKGVLAEAVQVKKIPVLGICLGMQLMCKGSEEGRLAGFGWVDADVKRFRFPPDSSLKIPHMGWNTIQVSKVNPLVSTGERDQRFYFVHSYHVVCNDPADVLATARHGYDFTAAYSHDNIFGVQFHPEKSHRFGMALLSNFIGAACLSIA